MFLGIYFKNDIFLVKPIKQDKYFRKHFAPENVPHRAKLSFSGIMKHFCQKFKKQLLKV